MRGERDALTGVTSERLRDVVRVALSEPGAEIATWDAAPLAARTRSVYLFRGVARVGTAERPWSVVLKVPAPDQHGPADATDWKRELLLYRSGLLDDLPAHLRAPRCYDADDPADGV